MSLLRSRIVVGIGIVLAIVISALLYVLLNNPQSESDQKPGGSKPSPESLVTFPSDQAKEDFLRQNGLTEGDLKPSNGLGSTYIVPVPKDELQPGEAIVAPRREYKALLTPNDTIYPQYYSTITAAPAAWEITTGSSSVTVAVIDTGFGLSHEDMLNRWAVNSGEIGGGKDTNGVDDDGNGFIDDWRGWDFANGSGDNNPNAGSTSPNGDAVEHGTLVSGLVGATGNNTTGIAGVSWGTRILPIQALSDDGSGFTEDIVAAVNYAVARGVKVINLSLGSPDPDSLLEAAINNAVVAGVTVVAAAGNCGDPGSYVANGCDFVGQMIYPARLQNVIAVAASDANDNRASFSSYGPDVDIIAPGTGAIRTTLWSQGNQTSSYTSSVNGTSIAAPIVSGTVALMYSQFPSITPSQVYAGLRITADKLFQMNGAVRTDQHGYGRLNIFDAVTIDQLPCPSIVIPNFNIPATPSGGKVIPNQFFFSGASQLSLTFLNNTGSSCIEAHTWGNNQQAWITNVATNHPAIDPADGEIISGNIYGDAKSELIFIKYRNTGSGRIEIHTWIPTYQRWASNIASNHPAIDPADGDVVASDVNGDGRDELLFVKYRNTGSGRIEVHTWGVNQQSWLSNVASNHGEVNPADVSVISANLYGDARDELVLVKYRNNGSGRVEMHTWGVNQQAWISNVASNHGEVNPADAIVLGANIYGGAIDELVFAKYRNTGSGKIEVHVWAAGQQSWLSNVGTNHPGL